MKRKFFQKYVVTETKQNPMSSRDSKTIRNPKTTRKLTTSLCTKEWSMFQKTHPFEKGSSTIIMILPLLVIQDVTKQWSSSNKTIGGPTCTDKWLDTKQRASLARKTIHVIRHQQPPYNQMKSPPNLGISFQVTLLVLFPLPMAMTLFVRSSAGTQNK
jgi:hypothetical protein